MQIGSTGGDTLELSVTGYQFPDAPEPWQRYSWHMVWGRASTARETWEFHWQALTCEESVRLGTWWERAADAVDAAVLGKREPAVPEPEELTEPNLTLDLVEVSGTGDASLRVGLDLEFRAPSNRRARGAGSPSTLRLTTSAAQLRAAAADWRADVARFPALGGP